MEKIKLNNGQIFELEPMGIITSDKRRFFSFKSELPYQEIETAFIENLEKVEYLSTADELLVTYVDCVSLKSISKDIETSIYTVEVSTDAVEKQLKDLQNQVNSLMARE